MTDDGARSLMAAMMLQAVKDYQLLCEWRSKGRIIKSDHSYTDVRTISGKRDRKYFGFDEIEKFVENYGEICVEMNPDKILQRLREQRRRAERRAERRGYTVE